MKGGQAARRDTMVKSPDVWGDATLHHHTETDTKLTEANYLSRVFLKIGKMFYSFWHEDFRYVGLRAAACNSLTGQRSNMAARLKTEL